MIRNMYDPLKEKIAEEFTIEIQDKIQLYADGVNVSAIYREDFITLRNLLYTDINWYNKRGKLTAEQVRALLNLIDSYVVTSLDYINYYLISHRKGVNYENR